MQSIELIITLACIAGFGLFVLVGFICLKKRFRLKWEHCCDSVFTCGGKYPSEKTEDLRKQNERTESSRNRNSSSVLSQPPAYFGGRKRPEEIEPLGAVLDNQQVTQQYTDADDIDIEAGNDDVPIVQQYNNPPSGRQSAASNGRAHQTTYYSSSTSRTYTSGGRAQTSRSDRDRDILVADDDEATL